MNEKDALEILKSESDAENFKSFPENLKTDRNFILKAVKINEIMISLSLRGAINKFVKFLLQISSKKSMLKLILDLKRIS